MFKTKCIYYLMLVLLLGVVPASCSDDDSTHVPSFSVIKVTPEKDVYKVGDVVRCSISQTAPASEDLRDASYWWYASWWFADSEMKADFQEFGADGVNTSSEITLTQAGDVTLYFFGRVEFPNYDWRKVEIGKKIKVVE